MSDYQAMKRDALIDALADAERFVREGKKALKGFQRHTFGDGSGRQYWVYDSVAHAAAKRASMDATRSLARFRRGGAER